jgi:hypothetical protein
VGRGIASGMRGLREDGSVATMIETDRVCNCGGGEFVFYGEMIQPAEPDVGIMGDVYQFTLSVEDSCCGCVQELSDPEIGLLEDEEADRYARDRV